MYILLREAKVTLTIATLLNKQNNSTYDEALIPRFKVSKKAVVVCAVCGLIPLRKMIIKLFLDNQLCLSEDSKKIRR